MAKPFVKWAGGKNKLIKTLVEKMPKEYNLYIEPFIGGGALFLELSPQFAIINDINKNLINCYKQIKNCEQDIINLLSKLEEEFNSQEDDVAKSKYYYQKRDLYNLGCDDKNLASLFIFLNKTGFNGLYRENKSGLFNVPFGHKKQITLYDDENIRSISKLLSDTSIHNHDFEVFFEEIEIHKGDFVFFDSPYAETFTQYNKSGFNDEDHKRLASLFNELSNMGVYCMATNNSCEYIIQLYNKWNIEEVDVMHAINRNGNDRMAKEVIITNY